jgi:gliding motility-associated-like protein
MDDGSEYTSKQPIHLYNSAGKYNVNYQIKTDYNCLYDTTKQVEVYPKPSALFSLDKGVGTILDPEVTITDLSSGADTLWYDLGDGTHSSLRNLMHLYPDSGLYYIKQYVRTQFNCNDSFVQKLRIKYLFVFNAPTAFSPNDDAINEVYEPIGMGIKNYEMSIFNRWGQLIYKTTEGKGWDGKFQGDFVQDGYYLAVFKVKDFRGISHYLKSSFILLR